MEILKNKEREVKFSSKDRSSNLELYRIIVMMLIVAHHYVVNSGLLSPDGPILEEPLAFKSVFLLVFGMWGKTGINCFVLITGFFMCKSNITVKKFVKLLLEVYFYRFVIYAVFLVGGYIPFEMTYFVKLFFPITTIADGFTSCFLVFYLTIPFLTILVKNMTEKQHRYLLFLCCFVYIVMGSIPFFSITFNYVTWFCVLFFIASYLRYYPRAWFDSTKLWGALTILSVGVSICSVLVMTWLEVKTGRMGLHYFWVSDSNKIMAVATSVTSFMLFKNLKLKNIRVINVVAASTFGVFLIHTNSDVMRQWLWKDVLNNNAAYYSDYIVIHALTSVMGVFIVCTIIDFLRIEGIEKRLLNSLFKGA